VPWATLFNKGITVGFGRTHDRRYTTHLRDMIISGRARPSQIITHHESLEIAPSIYDRFDRRVDGIVKAVFNHPRRRDTALHGSHRPAGGTPVRQHQVT
jgi:glutathione-independent formaldehyde dehydrogenase